MTADPVATPSKQVEEAAPQGWTAPPLRGPLPVPPRPRRPQRGARRALYRISRGHINLGPSSAERARQQRVGRARTPAATGQRRIAFVSLKGGVGKTTTTVMLGHTLATCRGDNVIAIDANPDAGNLASRVQRQTTAAARDLLRAAGDAEIDRYSDVRAFTSQAESRLEVLAADTDPALSDAFSAADYSAVLSALERFYSILLTDCGTGILHDAMRAVLWYADQVVVITSPAMDSAQALNQLLDWFDQHGYHHLVEGSVVVVNAVRRDSKAAVNQCVTHFGPRTRAVVTIPHDRALARGTDVELNDLSSKTQRAYLELAAVVGDGFSKPGSNSH